MSIRRVRVPLLLLVVVAACSVFVPAGWAGVTNTAMLDNGTCGRNLQLGLDRTASNSATPSFLLFGDGGLSSYQAFVDGLPVGIFYSDGYANVCVTTTLPLSDGPHQLTA